jgi:hypothetical protein
VAKYLKKPLEQVLLVSLTRMAEDKPLRLRLLAGGAILLVVAAILQLLVTL